MKTRTSVAAVVLLALLGALVLSACGGSDDPPAAREFENEDEAEDKGPPKTVQSEVDLSYKKGTFFVEVTADEDYCEEERTVTVFEDLKKDDKIGTTDSDEEGDGSVKEKKAKGKYYAVLAKEPSAKYGQLSICLGDKSQNLKV